MSNPERTKPEAVNEAEYNIRLHQLQQRLFKRVRRALALSAVIASSAVVVNSFGTVPWLTTVFGLIAATAGFLDYTGDYAERAACHGMWIRDYANLLRRKADLSLDEIDAELAQLKAEAQVEIESLRVVAWNDTLKSLGFEHAMREESRMQRFMRAVA